MPNHSPQQEQKLNKIMDKLATNDFFGDKVKLSQQDIDFLVNHPELLDKFTDVHFIKRKYIITLFYISVTMAGLAKTIEYSHIFSQLPILDDILSNVQFSVAMEMLGASITAYFLEVAFEKRVAQNRALLHLFQHQQNDQC